jgi:hypothetical protein
MSEARIVSSQMIIFCNLKELNDGVFNKWLPKERVPVLGLVKKGSIATLIAGLQSSIRYS